MKNGTEAQIESSLLLEYFYYDAFITVMWQFWSCIYKLKTNKKSLFIYIKIYSEAVFSIKFLSSCRFCCLRFNAFDGYLAAENGDRKELTGDKEAWIAGMLLFCVLICSELALVGIGSLSKLICLFK